MPLKAVNLSDMVNQDHLVGNPADFPVALRPVYVPDGNGSMEEIRRRKAVVRCDTGRPVAVVSDRYALVPHSRILNLVEEAITPLDLGPVPRGIFVDRDGARMRAVFKFPALSRAVAIGDEICPCLKIENTYDGTSRISIHIGAFRFVCTNLSVGGSGVFAGGFISIHAGEIPIQQVVDQLSSYLTGFEKIVDLYWSWSQSSFDPARLGEILPGLAKRHLDRIQAEIAENRVKTVYNAYNAATRYATHEMKSYRTAFDLLETVNHAFQRHYPVH